MSTALIISYLAGIAVVGAIQGALSHENKGELVLLALIWPLTAVQTIGFIAGSAVYDWWLWRRG